LAYCSGPGINQAFRHAPHRSTTSGLAFRIIIARSKRDTGRPAPGQKTAHWLIGRRQQTTGLGFRARRSSGQTTSWGAGPRPASRGSGNRTALADYFLVERKNKPGGAAVRRKNRKLGYQGRNLFSSIRKRLKPGSAGGCQGFPRFTWSGKAPGAGILEGYRFGLESELSLGTLCFDGIFRRETAYHPGFKRRGQGFHFENRSQQRGGDRQPGFFFGLRPIL